MTLVKRPKAKDINKVIPKDYHISGVEIERGIGYSSKYLYVTIKITNDEYLTNRELFNPSDDTQGIDYLERIENSKKWSRKLNQVDTPYLSLQLDPSQLKIKED